MSDLDRDRLIDLLGRLDAAADKDALAAGREIARLIKESGATWDEILTRPRNAPTDALTDASTAAPTDMGDKHGEAASDQTAGTLAPEEADEARGLIAALLAMDNISDSTREDIEGLRGDLGDGRFERSDLRYLRALRARLS